MYIRGFHPIFPSLSRDCFPHGGLKFPGRFKVKSASLQWDGDQLGTQIFGTRQFRFPVILVGIPNHTQQFRTPQLT